MREYNHIKSYTDKYDYDGIDDYYNMKKVISAFDENTDKAFNLGYEYGFTTNEIIDAARKHLERNDN